MRNLLQVGGGEPEDSHTTVDLSSGSWNARHTTHASELFIFHRTPDDFLTYLPQQAAPSYLLHLKTSIWLYRSCAALVYFSGHGDRDREKLEFDLKPLILNYFLNMFDFILN